MDFENKHGEWFQCRGTAWGITKMIARQYGWRPAGTLPPLEEDGTEPQAIHLIAAHQPKRLFSWITFPLKVITRQAGDYWDCANYHTNDGQRVTDEDAAALVEALSKARDGVKGTAIQEQLISDPEEWFTRFIVFFRKGGFSIH